MPITHDEKLTRDIVAEVHKSIQPHSTIGKETIREQAIAQFVKALDGKLANLQEGETLLLTFRVDIQRKDGEIRGGSGAERNMPEYIAWRKAVYERDNYTCQECGAKGNINAHHIQHWQSYPELRFVVSNGVTLCGQCHRGKHPHLRFINGRKKNESNTGSS